MYMGLTREQVIGILTESGIKEGTILKTKDLVEAIATVIVENNKLIRQSTTDAVTDDLEKQIKNLL